jgi:ribosomal protein S16
MRLTRIGGRKNPIWRVVVADQRSKRDGRVIETVGHYNAQTEPSTIVLNEERVRDWLARGAQPSDQVRKLLKLLEYLVRGLVENPDGVQIDEVEESDGTIVLELSVAEGDYGNVIGRGGRTASALRTIVKAAAVKDKRRVFVDIVDD